MTYFLHRPVTKWKRATLLRGRIWQWIAHRIIGLDSESCDRCGWQYRWLWWCEDTSVWRAAYKRATGRESQPYPVDLHTGLLCPRCFEDACDDGYYIEWIAHRRPKG